MANYEQMVEKDQRNDNIPNFFCDIDVFNYLLELETDPVDAETALTVSLVEIPFWFSFSQDSENWILNTYGQHEVFYRGEPGIDDGVLTINKETGEGKGYTVKELQENIELFFYACRNLSCLVKMEHMQPLFAGLDPQKSGILMSVRNGKLEYKVVSGKERPELTYSVMGEVMQGRPYLEEAFEDGSFWE